MKHRGRFTRTLARKTATLVADNKTDAALLDYGTRALREVRLLRSAGKPGDDGLRQLWSQVEILTRLSNLAKENRG